VAACVQFGWNFGLIARDEWFRKGGMYWIKVLTSDILVVRAGGNKDGFAYAGELTSLNRRDLMHLHAWEMLLAALLMQLFNIPCSTNETLTGKYLHQIESSSPKGKKQHKNLNKKDSADMKKKCYERWLDSCPPPVFVALISCVACNVGLAPPKCSWVTTW